MNRLLISAAVAGALAVVLYPALGESKRVPFRAEPTHNVWEGVYADSQAVAGQTAFTARGCVRCHGMDLKGTDDGAPLTGDDFAGDYEGAPIRAIFDQIRTAMPPDKPKSVPPDEVVQLVSFILARNHMPSGATPLTADTARLNDIKYLAKNPNPGAVPASAAMTRRVDTVRIGDTLRVIETIYIRGKPGSTKTNRLEDLKIFRK
jgi:mono/diheme cytochrome c family protein